MGTMGLLRVWSVARILIAGCSVVLADCIVDMDTDNSSAGFVIREKQLGKNGVMRR